MNPVNNMLLSTDRTVLSALRRNEGIPVPIDSIINFTNTADEKIVTKNTIYCSLHRLRKAGFKIKTICKVGFVYERN